MDEVAFAPATELVAAIDRKEISSVELLDAFVARIDKHNPAINAVVALDLDRARAACRAADDELARGHRRGPLHGLPMTIKDSIETEGVVTTSGAPNLAGHVPVRDADAVARLKAAGAIVFGKTNLPIYAGDCQTYNEVYGTTNNPWNLDRTPGGSSGGSAAALAAGLTGFELGSDIGGSIRNPAHLCGVFGLKPTYGIVPGRGHIPGPPGMLSEPDVASLGPLGRSTGDLALGLDVLAAAPPDRAVAWHLELPPPRRSALADYRLTAWLDDAAAPVDAAVLDALTTALDGLRGAGAAIDEDPVPVSLADASELFEQLVFTVTGSSIPEPLFEAACAVEATPRADDEPAPTRSARAVAMRHRTWARLNEARHRQRAGWAEFFGSHDAVLAPVMQTAAFPHTHEGNLFARTLTVNGEARPYVDTLRWCGAFGVVYLPAAVVPIGLTADGLPVGLQIVGPYLQDRTVLDIAGRVEQALGGFRSPPGY